MASRSAHSAIHCLCPAPTCVVDCFIESGPVLRTVLGVVQRATSSYTTNFETVVVEILSEFFNFLLGAQLTHDFESDFDRIKAKALGFGQKVVGVVFG